MRYGKHFKYGNEVSAFLRRWHTLEDGWRRDEFSDLPDETNTIMGIDAGTMILNRLHSLCVGLLVRTDTRFEGPRFRYKN